MFRSQIPFNTVWCFAFEYIAHNCCQVEEFIDLNLKASSTAAWHCMIAFFLNNLSQSRSAHDSFSFSSNLRLKRHFMVQD